MQKSVDQEEIEQHCMSAVARKRNRFIKGEEKMKKLMAFGSILLVTVLLVSVVGCSTSKQEVVPNEYLNDVALSASDVETKQQDKVEWNPGKLAAEQILEMQDLSEISFDTKGIFQKDYPVTIYGQKVTLSITLDRKMIDMIIDELIANNGLKDSPENRAKFEEKALEIHLGNQAVYAETDYMRTAPVPAMSRDEFIHRLTTFAGIYQGRVAEKDHSNEVTDEEFAWAVGQVVTVVEKYLALVDTTTNYDALHEAYNEELAEVMESLRKYF